MAATLHDTSLATDDGSGTVLTTEGLAVTAGDLVVVGYKYEGGTLASTHTVDTGDATPTFTPANAMHHHTFTGDHNAGTFYWIADSSGSKTVRVTIDVARTFRRIAAYAFTPGVGTTLQLGNMSMNNQGTTDAMDTGAASAIAAGVAVAFYSLYGSRGLDPNDPVSNWIEAAEHNISAALLTAYQFQSGAGSLTGTGRLTGTEQSISQLVIFNEVATGGDPSVGPVALLSQRNRRHSGRYV